MNTIKRLACVMFLMAMGTSCVAADKPQTKPAPDPKRFEKSILAFEAKDEQAMPPKNAIVCVGSSSMVGWHPTIAKDLAPLTVIPRGFGGSTMNDALFYVDRVVIKYQPRAVMVYEGDNDIKSGVTPEKFFETFQAFAAKIHEKLPRTRIYVLSIKPSPSRWTLWPKASEANKLVAGFCAKDPRFTFLNVAEGMMGPDGKVREDIFKADRLHMNPKGYEIWRDIVKPILVKAEQDHARDEVPAKP